MILLCTSSKTKAALFTAMVLVALEVSTMVLEVHRHTINISTLSPTPETTATDLSLIGPAISTATHDFAPTKTAVATPRKHGLASTDSKAEIEMWLHKRREQADSIVATSEQIADGKYELTTLSGKIKMERSKEWQKPTNLESEDLLEVEQEKYSVLGEDIKKLQATIKKNETTAMGATPSARPTEVPKVRQFETTLRNITIMHLPVDFQKASDEKAHATKISEDMDAGKIMSVLQKRDAPVTLESLTTETFITGTFSGSLVRTTYDVTATATATATDAPTTITTAEPTITSEEPASAPPTTFTVTAPPTTRIRTETKTKTVSAAPPPTRPPPTASPSPPNSNPKTITTTVTKSGPCQLVNIGGVWYCH